MMLAQQLYEGIDLLGDRTGLITYMRTDSLNLSQDAIAVATEFIKEKFEKYLENRTFKTKSKVHRKPTKPFAQPILYEHQKK